MTGKAWVRVTGYVSAIVLSLVIGSVADAVPTPVFMGLGGTTGVGHQNQALAVSADGSTVVGQAGPRPYRWRFGTGMQFIGNSSGRAYGVSANGSVVVGTGAGFPAFRWSQSTGVQGLGNFPGASANTSEARAVSGDGSMVAGTAPSAPPPSRDYDSFLWTSGTGMQSLGDVPGGRSGPSLAMSMSLDGSVIVGQTVGPLDLEAYRWTESTGMLPLSGIPAGFRLENASGVSADGSTVVGYGRSPNTGPAMYEAFRWSESGGFQPLGDIEGGAFSSGAWAVSGDGKIVVGEGNTGSFPDDIEAFIWDETHGIRNLRLMLVNDFGLNLDGWILNAARGISADGNTIAGYGVNPQGYQESWVAVIPEPSGAALAGICLVGMLLRRRAHRAK